MKNALTAVAVIVVVAALAVGGWFGYWALAKASVNNQYDVNTDNQQYQSGLISQERDRLNGYDQATDPGQKASLKDQFCTVYLELTKPPADLQNAYARVCG